MEGEEWYYVSNGEQKGPVPFKVLQSEWNQKAITEETYVWCDLMDNWQPISECRDLKALLSPPKARLPPPIPSRKATPSVATPTQDNAIKPSAAETSRPQPSALHSSLLKEIEGASIQRTLRHVNADSKSSGGSSVEQSAPLSANRAAISSPSIMKPSMMKASGSSKMNPAQSAFSKPVQSTSMKPNTMQTTSVKTNSAQSSVKPSSVQTTSIRSIRPSSVQSSSVKPSPAQSSTKSGSIQSTSHIKSQQPVMEERIITPSHTSTIRCGVRGGGWEERFTVDDVPYYYNKSTDCLSWEKPECLRTEEEKKEGSTRWAWLEDEEEAWIPVCVDSEKGKLITGRSEDGRVLSGKGAGDVHWSSLRELPDDVVLLEDSNEPSILYTVRKRYLENKIYTWVGSNHTILLSVNPFQPLPLYTPEQIETHSHPPLNKPLPPHVYDIAYSAFQELSAEGTDQSILISGESGAGKTEATKQCLGFIAEIAGSDSSLEQKILQTNPVLEAFGNAKTVRNNNSSRFGKWIEIHFDDHNRICGASIESYLLEKSRVVAQQENERNFHIFYQLFTSSELCHKYNLTTAADYRYLTGGHCLSVKGIDDAADFIDVISSFEALAFSTEERDQVLQLVVAVLKLGNIQFVESGANTMHPEAKVQNRDVLEEAATLLCVPCKALEEAVCTRRIVVREGSTENVTVIPLSVIEASQNCDALAKELYSRVFDYIVDKINQTLNGERNKFIGFLDIFGFEIFQHNSFEQLCINYANERLQQLFNQSTFKEEETVYRNEGIQFSHIDFIDNTEVLEMIESKYGGLFCAINDQVKIRNGTDTNLMKNVKNTLTKYSCFDGNCPSPRQFAITHYAGKVIYDIQGFTDKNRDRIYDNLYDLVASSSSSFISSLFPHLTTQQMKETVCSKFQKQLSDLVAILQRSQRKYIRCIKPNDQKRKLLFDCTHSLEQIRYSGIFEAVKIRKLGYPFRLAHKQFVHRYKCLAMVKNPDAITERMPIKDQISVIVKTRPECDGNIFCGRSLVLYRAGEHRILELARNLALDELLPHVQSVIKSKICSVGLPLYVSVTQAMQTALQSKDLAVIEKAISMNEQQSTMAQQLLGRSVPVMRKASQAVEFLKKISVLENRVREMMSGNIESNLENLMAVVEEIQSQPDLISEKTWQLAEEARKCVESYASSLIEPPLTEALNILDREELIRILEQASRLNYSSDNTREGTRLISLPEEDFFQLEIERAEQLGDISRLVDRKIKLRDLLLHRNQSRYDFASFTGLKTPEEYASHKILTVNRKWWRETAFKFITMGIPTCLTNAPREMDKQGQLLFKSIQGYMKDRKYSMSEDALAVDMVRMIQGYKNPSLRTEAYCQLIKQLTENPSTQSVSLGWDLLAVFINWFLPEETFVNYLIVFIWEKAPNSDKYMELFNNSYYSSKYYRDSSFLNGLRSPPSQPSDVRDFLTEFANNSRRYSIENKLASYKGAGSSSYATLPSSTSRNTPSYPLNPSHASGPKPLQNSVHPSGYNTLQSASPRASGYNTLQSRTNMPVSSSPRSSTFNTLHSTSPRSSAFNTLRSSSPRPGTYTVHRSPSPHASGILPNSSPRTSAYNTLRSTSPRVSAANTIRSSSPRSSVIMNGGTLHKPRSPAPLAPPPPPPSSSQEIAIVLYDISVTINPNVLECKEGDRIIIEEDHGDWLLATMDGREGYVPYNYIQRMK